MPGVVEDKRAEFRSLLNAKEECTLFDAKPLWKRLRWLFKPATEVSNSDCPTKRTRWRPTTKFERGFYVPCIVHIAIGRTTGISTLRSSCAMYHLFCVFSGTVLWFEPSIHHYTYCSCLDGRDIYNRTLLTRNNASIENFNPNTGADILNTRKNIKFKNSI